MKLDGIKVLDQYISPWANIFNADTCEAIVGIPDNAIDFSVFSPPFEGLFCYSASDRDLGNTHGGVEFAKHLSFIATQQFRTMKPGRMVAMHCMDLPMTLTHHGEIGRIDFPSRLREVYERAGFIYYGRVTIWKDPVVAQERTHTRQLVYHEMCKDSSMSGVVSPDYIVLMRKPGKNEVPIVHDGDPLAVKNDAGKPEHWQRVASAVWGMPEGETDTMLRMLAIAIRSGDKVTAERIAGTLAEHGGPNSAPFPSLVWATANGLWKDGFIDYEDPRAGNLDKRGIDQGDTLNFRAAREHKDERHICPIQRGIVYRLLDLYTNKHEVVLTPFLGIGTEVVCAIEKERRGIGFELKGSYFRQAREHVKRVEPGAAGQQTALFDFGAGKPKPAVSVVVDAGQPWLATKQGACADCQADGSVGTCGICGGEVR